MKLRTKVLLTVTITVVLMMMVLFSIIRPALLNEASDMDKLLIEKNAERVYQYLESEKSQLQHLVADWANWDDTYNFIADGNSRYIEVNLNKNSVEKLEVGFMILLKPNLEMLYQTAGIEGMLHSDYLSNQIVEHFKQNNRVNNVDLMETILGDALIAMESVNFSESKGKNGGYLIMGRMLDDAFMSKMGRNLSLNLELTKAESPMKNSRQIEVEIIDENLLEATVNTYPISSGNIYRFSMIGERELYMDKKKDSVTYMLYLIAFGLFFMLILHVSLDRLIVSRIGKLAKNFGEQRSFSSRIQVDKGYLDEITNLQLSMNDVLDSLQKHRDKLAFQSQHHFLVICLIVCLYKNISIRWSVIAEFLYSSLTWTE